MNSHMIDKKEYETMFSCSFLCVMVSIGRVSKLIIYLHKYLHNNNNYQYYL